MKLRYTTDGTSLSESDERLGDFERRCISMLQQSVRRKTERLTWRCGCKHEQRLHRFCTEGGDPSSEAFAVTVLCSETVRAGYPNCAHVEGNGRDPDPFGTEIRSLMAIELLDETSWNAWLATMRFAILAVDGAVSRSLMDQRQANYAPLPPDKAAEDLQEINIAELQNKGSLLLEILTKAVEE